MTISDKIAAASAAVAVISIVANIFQFLISRRLQRKDAAKEDVCDALRILLTRLEYTQFFSVAPMDEIWEYGFESLRELAVLCASADILIQHSTSVNDTMRNAVADLHERVRSLRSFRNSYTTFAHGKTGSPASIQMEWPQWQLALATRQAAIPSANILKKLIHAYLGNDTNC